VAKPRGRVTRAGRPAAGVSWSNSEMSMHSKVLMSRFSGSSRLWRNRAASPLRSSCIVFSLL